MYLKVNSFLRKRAPHFHQFLKQTTSHWRNPGNYTLPIPLSRSGEWFWLHPYFATHGQIEPHVQSHLRSVLRPGDVFFDIGANFGFHSILASRLVGRTDRVIAFEPSPENLKLLRYHCRTNFLKNIQICPDAVGNSEKNSVEFVLLNGGRHSSNSLNVSDKSPHLSSVQKTVIKVPMTTIDSVCEKLGLLPTLIKIYVEGAELFVLEGARKIIAEARPKIIIGIHPFWFAEGQKTEDIIDFFTFYDYEIKTFEGERVDDIDYGDYIVTPR